MLLADTVTKQAWIDADPGFSSALVVAADAAAHPLAALAAGTCGNAEAQWVDPPNTPVPTPTISHLSQPRSSHPPTPHPRHPLLFHPPALLHAHATAAVGALLVCASVYSHWSSPRTPVPNFLEFNHSINDPMDHFVMTPPGYPPSTYTTHAHTQ